MVGDKKFLFKQEAIKYWNDLNLQEQRLLEIEHKDILKDDNNVISDISIIKIYLTEINKKESKWQKEYQENFERNQKPI